MSNGQKNSDNGYSKVNGGGGSVNSVSAGVGIAVAGTATDPIVSADLVAGANVTLTPGPGNAITIAASAGAAGIQSIIAGQGIEVIPVDPLNPIVQWKEIRLNASLTFGAPDVPLKLFQYDANVGFSAQTIIFQVSQNSAGAPWALFAFTRYLTGVIKLRVLQFYLQVPTIHVGQTGSVVTIAASWSTLISSAGTCKAFAINPQLYLESPILSPVLGPVAPQYTLESVIAGSGVSIDSTNPESPIISATGGGVVTTNAGGATMPASLVRTRTSIPNVNNGGAVYATYRQVSASIRVARLGAFLAQVGSGLATLGVYDLAGNLLAKTAAFTPNVIGDVIKPIAFDGAGNPISYIDLAGGISYYFAIHCNQSANGAQFYGVDAGTTFGPEPFIGRGTNNVATMPASIAGTSEAAQRYLVTYLAAP